MTNEEAHMGEHETCRKLRDGTYTVGFWLEIYFGAEPFHEWIELGSGTTRDDALKDRVKYWEEYERE